MALSPAGTTMAPAGALAGPARKLVLPQMRAGGEAGALLTCGGGAV